MNNFLFLISIINEANCTVTTNRRTSFLHKLTHFFSTTVPNILLLPLASQSIRLSYTPTVAARCFWYSNNCVMSTCTFFTEPSCHLNWTMAFCKSYCTQDFINSNLIYIYIKKTEMWIFLYLCMVNIIRILNEWFLPSTSRDPQITMLLQIHSGPKFIISVSKNLLLSQTSDWSPDWVQHQNGPIRLMRSENELRKKVL